MGRCMYTGRGVTAKRYSPISFALMIFRAVSLRSGLGGDWDTYIHRTIKKKSTPYTYKLATSCVITRWSGTTRQKHRFEMVQKVK